VVTYFMDMDLVRKLKKYRAPLPEVKLKQSLNSLKTTGLIDGINGAVNVGLILDTFNNDVVKRKEKDFANEANARNKYYAPLWKLAVEEQMNSSRFKHVITPPILGTDIKRIKKQFEV
jgi:hypothetical protein